MVVKVTGILGGRHGGGGGGGGGRSRAAKRRDRTQWSESCQNQAGEEELGLSLSGQ